MIKKTYKIIVIALLSILTGIVVIGLSQRSYGIVNSDHGQLIVPATNYSILNINGTINDNIWWNNLQGVFILNLKLSSVLTTLPVIVVLFKVNLDFYISNPHYLHDNTSTIFKDISFGFSCNASCNIPAVPYSREVVVVFDNRWGLNDVIIKWEYVLLSSLIMIPSVMDSIISWFTNGIMNNAGAITSLAIVFGGILYNRFWRNRLIKCKHCNNKIRAVSKYCPICGEKR